MNVECGGEQKASDDFVLAEFDTTCVFLDVVVTLPLTDLVEVTDPIRSSAGKHLNCMKQNADSWSTVEH